MRKLAACSILLGLSVSAAARDLSRYALVLPDPPAAQSASRENPAALAAARDRLRPAHESLKQQLRLRKIKVVGETFSLVNAVFVAADAAELTGLTGVAQIAKMPRYHRDLDAAVKLINVPAAWNVLTNAGAGIKIAVIDTGIDNTHPAFQDSTLTAPAGFPVCDTMADCVYTNSKVIVARSYVSFLAAGTGSDPAADSRPDDLSARDRVGHGTAVAMAAAGNTNTGPSDTITGVAPKAFLGNYKVFGSPGVNDFTTGDAIISALNDAFDDGMDVAELSLGGTAIFGPLDTGSICGLSAGQPCDLDAYTVQLAINSGMMVVAAAGNSGPALGSLGSPSDAPGAISVAAINNSHNWSNGLTVNGLGSFHAALGDGPAPSPSLTAPLADIASVGDPQGCTAPPAGSLSGVIALVARGTCTFVVKVQSAQAAGAVGVIFTDNVQNEGLVAPGGLAGVTTIASTFIDYDDGQSIRGYLATNPQASATITANLVAFPATDTGTMTSFSSRGPALAGSSVKPDVAAVGANLYLAAQSYDPNGELYSPNGYIVSQGTSFSAPQIAGLAALVKQSNRALQPAQIKSAIVDTAIADVIDTGAIASVTAAGSGRANGAAAIATTLFASPASVSFGVLNSSTLALTQPIQLTNTGASAQSVSVTITRRIAETTAHLSVDQPSLQIPAAGSATLNLTLSGTLPSPGIYEGSISAGNLVIPFLYVVPDGVATSIVTVAGNGDIGIVGQQNAEGGLLFQVLDHYGVPVPNLPVTFAAGSGGGSVSNSDAKTDVYGFAASNDTLGTTPGTNVFRATAGSLSTSFAILASAQPMISPNGAVNAANFVNQPVAPGSYIALFGSNLAPLTAGFTTSYLPLSIGEVSVSFDTPAVSAPGHLTYVSPGLVVVQVPWELNDALAAGQTAAQIKVSDSFNSGAIYNLPLASFSPAFFETSPGFAAALDQNNQIVTTSNAVGQGSTVQLFLNGLGPVSNQPASGDPAPFTPLAQTNLTPTITIGQLNAPVKFSGLTPGTIGLYQINAVVPATGAGLQPITVSINGVSGTVSHIQVR